METSSSKITVARLQNIENKAYRNLKLKQKFSFAFSILAGVGLSLIMFGFSTFSQNIKSVEKQYATSQEENRILRLNKLGTGHLIIGEFDAAIDVFGNLIDIVASEEGEKSLDYIITSFSLAMAYRGNGQYQKAELLYKNSLSISIEMLGANHPFVVSSYEQLIHVYMATGEIEKAKEIAERYHIACNFIGAQNCISPIETSLPSQILPGECYARVILTDETPQTQWKKVICK